MMDTCTLEKEKVIPGNLDVWGWRMGILATSVHVTGVCGVNGLLIPLTLNSLGIILSP